MGWTRKVETRKRAVRIGSRGSQLALIQTRSVLAELERTHPDIQFELTTIVTTGDHRRPLAPLVAPGIFVKEMEEALLSRRIDLAVHSLKDMPTDIPLGLALAAVTERLDPRDVLISPGGQLAELPPGATIGTGSWRRTAQLRAYRPDLKVVPMRGNVPTRLQKVSSGEVNGVIVAAAGVIRLGLQQKITQYLPPAIFLPPVGQGALAIEIRDSDKDIVRLVAPLNHEPSQRGVTAERAFLHTLGGGCHTPVGALATIIGNTVRLQGMVASSDGRHIIRDVAEGNDPAEVGRRLGERMLAAGAAALMATGAA